MADSVYQSVSSPPVGEATEVDGSPSEVFADEDLDTTESARGFAGMAGMAAAFLLAMAAGATAPAYGFRADLAAIIAAWQRTLITASFHSPWP